MSFVEARKLVALIADEHGVKLSNRKCKAVAAELATQQQMLEDGEASGSLHYKDPTGDAAVRRVLALITK
jgi:hypothetical protein